MVGVPRVSDSPETPPPTARTPAPEDKIATPPPPPPPGPWMGPEGASLPPRPPIALTVNPERFPEAVATSTLPPAPPPPAASRAVVSTPWNPLAEKVPVPVTEQARTKIMPPPAPPLLWPFEELFWSPAPPPPPRTIWLAADG